MPHNTECIENKLLYSPVIQLKHYRSYIKTHDSVGDGTDYQPDENHSNRGVSTDMCYLFFLYRTKL